CLPRGGAGEADAEEEGDQQHLLAGHEHARELTRLAMSGAQGTEHEGPRSPLRPTASNSTYPGTNAIVRPNNAASSTESIRSHARRASHAPGTTSTRATAHGEGTLPFDTVRTTTATMSCMISTPMAIRP